MNQPSGYNHVEAFCLMYYENKETRTGFVVWNSRDGVTPFCVFENGVEYQHQHWSMDRRVVGFKPEPGQRIFRDTTPEEVQDLARRRMEQFRDTEYWVDPDSERGQQVMKGLVEQFAHSVSMVITPAA